MEEGRAVEGDRRLKVKGERKKAKGGCSILDT